MNRASRVLTSFANQVSRLASAETTSELSFYPALRELLQALIEDLGLRFDVRTSTTERRTAGGIDLPDIAVYDGDGDFVVVCGEVKLPDADLAVMARSTDRGDQVGRYLARTRVVILTNVRGFGLLVASPAWRGQGPVPVNHRRLEQSVELWPSVTTMRRGGRPSDDLLAQLEELIETALTLYAPIAEPETLARVLARQARRAKAALPVQFGQAVKRLADDFGTALGIKFEGDEGLEFFRSSLVQTVFYGLFAAWLLYARQWRAVPFRWQDLNEYLGIPFLGGLFHEIENPSRLRELGLRPYLDRATETLGRVNRESFFARLQVVHRAGSEEEGASSAIVYFYEPFLQTFDPELRKQLGVWYTPPDIVRYQVRRVDRLLRDQLNCPLGFADQRVIVLDPCCGTGAYLLEVLNCVAETLRGEGVEAELGATLRRAVHERVLGFELLTAPFVVAHVQIYLFLAELGAVVNGTDRPGVFLTNSLSGWRHAPQLNLAFPELNEEREAAQRIKTDARIIVMLGNPPYNRFVGAPIAEEQELIDPYKGIRRDRQGRQRGQSELFTRWGVRKHLLDDLYIRFFRLAEERIGHHAEFGVVSFISNSSFLTGRSHPIMRQSLLAAFDEVWIDQLNGDKYRTGKVIPEGEPGAGTSDQSVFVSETEVGGIQVGTAITTWLKRPGHVAEASQCRVQRRDFWGQADAKRRALLESLEMGSWTWEHLTEAIRRPEGPRDYETFTPSEDEAWRLVSTSFVEGYEDWPALDELFPVAIQGVNPNRGLDGSVVDAAKDRLTVRMSRFLSDEPEGSLRGELPGLYEEWAGYDPEAVREALRAQGGFQPAKIRPYLLFPLDARFIYYETEARLLNRPRPELAEIMPLNEFLVAVPQPRRVSEAFPLLSTELFDLHLHDRGSVGFPAERIVEVETALHGVDGPPRQRVTNLREPTVRVLQERLGWDSSTTAAAAKQVFRVILALTYAPSYLEDHAEALAHDWARVPLPHDPALFAQLVSAGDLLHRLLDPWRDARSGVQGILGPDGAGLARLARLGGGAVAEGDLTVTIAHFGAARGGWRARTLAENEPTQPTWGDGTGDLYLNEQVLLRHVPPAVWNFELGGYPVIKKWLGYREARRRDGAPLTLAEKDHLRSMVQRIAALLVLRSRLDELYDAAAADAFTTDELSLRGLPG